MQVSRKKVLITGGAGFIGTNLADRLARDGERVLLFDDLSRPGVARNAGWLLAQHGDRVELEQADVRDVARIARAVREASSVFHLAAQVAVTSSLVDPVHDFEVNARGTLNVLEAVRARPAPPPLVFTSTNKVYGALDDVRVETDGKRYGPLEGSGHELGISERRPIAFHSPYGCSKGSADQYVLDYARVFRLPACVFRMSCIYGPHQHGTEDQGWVAHLLRAALRGEPITVYGDGQQVRDLLHVRDLVEALLAARAGMKRAAGEAFNVGGGPERTLSLLELVSAIEAMTGTRPTVRFADWRAADQRWYVSDTRKIGRALGWHASVGVPDGLKDLGAWLAAQERRAAAADAVAAAPL